MTGTHASLVYFLRSGASGPVKIGLSTDLAKRLRQLRSASPECLSVALTIPGGRELELRLHRAFHASRMRGEWFRPTRELLAVIGLAKAKGPDTVQRWLERKEAAIEFRPNVPEPTEDLTADVEALTKIAITNAVARHGIDRVAEAMGKSRDVIESMRSRPYAVPVTSWFGLCLLDPGACMPLFARVGPIPVWLAAASEGRA